MRLYAQSRGGSSSVRLSVSSVLLMALIISGHRASGMPDQGSPEADTPHVSLRSLLLGTLEDVHLYLESVLGKHLLQSATEVVSTVILFLAEGAASGLNVIAVYVTEIVRVTGLDVSLPFPRFTPEGVASVAQWGLLALIGYWLLSITLRLLIGLLRRLFWLVKTLAVLWLFGLIVGDGSAPADVTAVRLAALVLGCVLLGVAQGGGGAQEGVASVETRLSALEGRLKSVEKHRLD